MDNCEIEEEKRMTNDNLENSGKACRAGLSQKVMFLLIGGGIGAGLALLFAPKPGRQLRHDIADLAGKGYDKTLLAANEMKNQATEFYDAAKQTGAEVLDVVSTGVARIKEEVKSDADEIVTIVEDSAKRAVTVAKPVRAA